MKFRNYFPSSTHNIYSFEWLNNKSTDFIRSSLTMDYQYHYSIGRNIALSISNKLSSFSDLLIAKTQN